MKATPWTILALLVVLSLAPAGCGSTPPPAVPTSLPTDTPLPPTNTPIPPTNTPIPPTNTPTLTPTNTPLPPTNTPSPPTNTPTLTPTYTPVPPTDTPTPTKTPVPPTKTPKPKPTATKPKPTATKQAPPPPTQGCLMIQNHIGAELTITFTAQDRQWSDTTKVGPGGSKFYCLDPGRYTFTVDAPPPWGSTSGEFTIQAGDMLLFPIGGG